VDMTLQKKHSGVNTVSPLCNFLHQSLFMTKRDKWMAGSKAAFYWSLRDV